MVGAAKLFSVLGESKDAGVINIQHGLAALPCCNEKWRIQYGKKAKMSKFLDFSTKIIS